MNKNGTGNDLICQAFRSPHQPAFAKSILPRRTFLRLGSSVMGLPTLSGILALAGCGGNVTDATADSSAKANVLNDDVQTINTDLVNLSDRSQKLKEASTQLGELLTRMDSSSSAVDTDTAGLTSAIDLVQGNAGDLAAAQAILNTLTTIRDKTALSLKDVQQTIDAFVPINAPSVGVATTARADQKSVRRPPSPVMKLTGVEICLLLAALITLLLEYINNLNALIITKNLVDAEINALTTALNAITTRITNQIRALETQRARLVQLAANANPFTRPIYDAAILAIDAALLSLNLLLIALTTPIRARIAVLQAESAALQSMINNLRGQISSTQAQIASLQGSDCTTGGT